jgi:4a-hydroxytetrahydrobiopterin dehydratase
MRHLQQYRGFDSQEAPNSTRHPNTRREEVAIKENMGDVPEGWVTADNSLYKRFVFEDFNVAMEFMSQVAEVCNQMNHHPKWTNIYKTVECWLRTHDAEAITDADHELAQAMDRIASQLL